MDRIDVKGDNVMRLILFNVNGINTFCNYHPWNTFNRNYDAIFNSLAGDIISLQELKLSTVSSANLANLSSYKSFITLPKVKKGYSGVGLFIRSNLTVIKAEEGITGYLNPGKTRYKDLDNPIGGYIDIDPELALKIDLEGRAVVVELASNIVIFSVYCPANSMGTEEGEDFKNQFTDILIRRAAALEQLGKKVVILGDINVSLDLIDQADGINERIKKKLIVMTDQFETTNRTQCIKFKSERTSRYLLNRYVHQHKLYLNLFDKPLFYDTTREKQGRKMGIYTCWNLINGSRQTNYGSRIDLILTTWIDNLVNANAWPFLQGSDHCPIFADFKVEPLALKTAQPRLAFEAKTFYKLHQRDISSFFGKRKSSQEQARPSQGHSQDETDSRNTSQPKKKPKITDFFKKETTEEALDSKKQAIEILKDELIDIEEISIEEQETILAKIRKPAMNFDSFYGEPPKCHHGQKCQLKTSLKNPSTRGKKFWCCPINSIGLENEGRCSYFEWLQKKT